MADRPERLRPDSDLLERLTGVAALAAPAIQNGQLVDQLRQRAAAGPIAMQQPDRHRAVAGVVGEHDQVAHDEDPPVADLPWPWPGVRDANGD